MTDIKKHTNKVFLYNISQGYSIQFPRGVASIFSKQRSGQKNKKGKKEITLFIVFLHLDTCKAM